MWAWRCLLGGTASLLLRGFAGCCRKGVPAILEVFPSSHFCLCSPYAFFKVNLTLYPKKTSRIKWQTLHCSLVVYLYATCFHLLPDQAQPPCQAVLLSPGIILPPLWGYVQEVSFSRAKGTSALKVFWLTCYFCSLRECCQVDEGKKQDANRLLCVTEQSQCSTWISYSKIKVC